MLGWASSARALESRSMARLAALDTVGVGWKLVGELTVCVSALKY